MPRRRPTALAALLVAAACAPAGNAPSMTAAPASDVEAVTPLGRTYRTPVLPNAAAAIATADAAVAAAPDDPDKLLAAAGARASAWRFREAMALYSRGMERWPSDARFPRFRGHRYITTRRFAEAAADLDRAAALDSTDFDIIYHQGLAHYLLGHYARAAEAYARCLGFAQNAALRAREAAGAYRAGYRSCMRIATDDDSRVSMSDWAWRAYTLAGRPQDAARLLEPIREDLAIRSNRSYFENLLMYKGLRSPDQLIAAIGSDSVRLASSGYAVAQQLVMRGDSARGWAYMERVANGPHWSGFGVIAAEVDLARRRATR